MVDIVPTPIEKLVAWRIQHIELGKEFKENEIRASINDWWRQRGGDAKLLLPMVDSPEYIPESAERARSIRMDERAAKAEVDRAKEEGLQLLETLKRDDDYARLLQQRIDELEQKLAQVAGASQTEQKPQLRVVEQAGDDRPDMSWSRQRLIEYAKRVGAPITPDATKAELLQTIYDKTSQIEEVVT